MLCRRDKNCYNDDNLIGETICQPLFIRTIEQNSLIFPWALSQVTIDHFLPENKTISSFSTYLFSNEGMFHEFYLSLSIRRYRLKCTINEIDNNQCYLTIRSYPDSGTISFTSDPPFLFHHNCLCDDNADQCPPHYLPFTNIRNICISSRRQ